VRDAVEGLFPVECDGVDTRASLLVHNARPSEFSQGEGPRLHGKLIRKIANMYVVHKLIVCTM
jgi:hypothetical protein